ncbi:glycoside hydrolase family 97 catalytic domain-containing protein [Paenibacillus lautus]|uniref:glycoside hydrolase family 97 protein n=1 Tax=Paenibacillus lautus TaxID=1401 RepID=UPI00384AB0A7
MDHELSPSLSAPFHAQLFSPDGNLKITLEQAHNGPLLYTVMNKGFRVLERSPLGLITDRYDFQQNIRIQGVEHNTIMEHYELVTGKQKSQSYEASELVLLASVGHHQVRIRFRAFRDGAAYRYELQGEDDIRIENEISGFHLPEDRMLNVWAQPFMRCYERTYDHAMPDDLRGGHFGFPLLVQSTEEQWLLLTEAAVDGGYGGSHLAADEQDGRKLRISYAPDQETPIAAQLPLSMPWRVMIIGSLGDLVTSSVTTHLCPPPVLKDTSWIAPGRAAWSWYAEGDSCGDMDIQRQHVDFAAGMGWEYVVVDGGWEGVLDAPQLIDYAKERGVGIWLWTHYQGLNTEELREEKLRLWASWGAVGIKVDFFDSDNQETLQVYDAIAESAARHRLMVNFHGSTKPSGEHRTWPHVMTREGVYGAEYYRAQSEGPNAVHLCTLPFTRNVIGSMDFTPVTFSRKTNTTQGLQLALAILFESGIQHYADAISVFADHPGKPLLAAVPAVWDETRLLEGYPGRYVTIARRSGTEWFVASICAAGGRDARIPLDFLDDHTAYQAVIYQEQAEPDEYRYRSVLPPIEIRTETCCSTDTITKRLKIYGGLSIHLTPL